MLRFALLKLLLPIACAWAERQERDALAEGVPLSAAQLDDAVSVGLAHPERVRLCRVSHMPWPAPRVLVNLLERCGAIPPLIAGLTLRYAIYLRHGCWDDRRLLAHELAHTAQYERLGGFRPFLKQYLEEWLTVGYPQGALEVEAERAAREICR
jgi:hypothetical protein